MRKPLILVTGATGKTGSATIKQLLAQGYQVRALARRADERSTRLRQAGAEVVVGSLEDATDLRTAMAGVQRAYYRLLRKSVQERSTTGDLMPRAIAS
jgi:NAD(P)H dehydrogenase (quinone)